MNENTIRILTRDSFLALAQTIQVSDYLMKKGFKVEVKALKTSGDIKLDAPLYQIAQNQNIQNIQNNLTPEQAKEGKAFFTKELEDGLLKNEGDLAVHSLKDLPTQLPEGLMFSSAIMAVESSDTLVTLEKLPEDAESQIRHLNSLTIGTSSLRRIAVLKYWIPESNLSSVRGNLVTRLEKLLNQSGMNSLILATAGLKRLRSFYDLWTEKRDVWAKLLDSEIIERIDKDYARLTLIFSHKLYFYEMDPKIFPPAVSQGVLGVETRVSDHARISKLFETHENLDRRIALERQLLSKLEAGCHIPYGNLVESVNEFNQNYFRIFLFFARNYNPEKAGKVDYFTAERLIPMNYTQQRIDHLIDEVKGNHYPVVFCGLKNEKFAEYFKKRNSDLYQIPLIKIESSKSETELLDHYDMAVVVSKNSVDHIPEKIPQISNWICVGEKTAEYLSENFKKRNHVIQISIPGISDGISSAKLVLEKTDHKPARILWLGAVNGKTDGIELLQSKGYQVTVYQGYQTEAQPFTLPETESSRENFLEKTSWWVFTSPSSAKSYLDQKLHNENHLISVIGKSTAEVFFNNGITPSHIASKSDLMMMAEEISGFSSHKQWKIKQWSI